MSASAENQNGNVRVLVIDDEPELCELVRRVLLKAGYDVAFASGGADGLAKFRRAPAQVVIVDLFMPDRDGLETIVELSKERPAPAVIAMSGHWTKDLMLRSAERLGALEILEKPFRSETLLAAVEMVLRREW